MAATSEGNFVQLELLDRT